MAFGTMGESPSEEELLVGKKIEFTALCSELAAHFGMQNNKVAEQLESGLKRGIGGRMRKNLEAPDFHNTPLTIVKLDENGLEVEVEGWKCGFSVMLISSLDPASGEFTPSKCLRCSFRHSPQAWAGKKIIRNMSNK